MSNIKEHEVLIIGGGLAGLRAAYECAIAGKDVALVSKVHPLRSHSVAAQGGINAALANHPDGHDDTWEKHAFDTVKGSDYLADQDAVETLTKEAPQAVIDLEHMGTVFSRFDDGKIAQRPFGGAGFPRTCYAADRTGHNLLHTLFEQTLAKDVKFYDEYFVTSLAVDEGRCVGFTALDIATGELVGFSGKAVLLATGGYGRLFNRSTNALINQGDGAALALKAGVPLKDMEFVQFHPTTLYGTNILMSEGCRGEGGILYNNKGERFMERYAPKAKDLAPRDIVARSIQTEVDEGRGFEDEYVHLDLTHLGAERIKERLPGIRQIAIDFAGIDPIEKPLPVQPGQHYSMGGIDCDKFCRTPLPGLYSAGEAACVSVHGANRLGGNSLLETVVFGKVAGKTMAEDVATAPGPSKGPIEELLKDEQHRLDSMRTCVEGEPFYRLRDELKDAMFKHFGVFREGLSMQEGLNRVMDIVKRSETMCIGNDSKIFNHSLVHTLETEFLMLLAEPVALGALKREESRGSHFRPDFPTRDDEKFLRHSIIELKEDRVVLSYKEVKLGTFEVKERVY